MAKTKEIEKLYKKLDKMICDEYVEILQYMFDKNKKKIKRITNCMGVTGFYSRINGEPLWFLDEQKLIGFSKYSKILDKYNDVFFLLGFSVSISDKGTIFKW